MAKQLDQASLVTRSRSSKNLDLGQDLEHLLVGHIGELRTLQRNAIVGQDLALTSNVLGSQDVITSHHANSNTSTLSVSSQYVLIRCVVYVVVVWYDTYHALQNGSRNLRTNRIFDTSQSNQDQVLLRWFIFLFVLVFRHIKDLSSTINQSIISTIE